MADDRRTKAEPGDARTYLASVANARRRADAQAVLELMAEVTGVEPVMWGPSMVGFGRHLYTTADGKERETFAVGLAPRAAALTLYGLTEDGADDLLARLGSHTTGTACLYLKRLEDVDRDVLREMITSGWMTNHVP